MFCFLRSGRTTACLKESGTEPDERDSLMMEVIVPTVLSRCFIKRGVGIGSRQQDFGGDEIMMDLTSSSVTHLKSDKHSPWNSVYDGGDKEALPIPCLIWDILSLKIFPKVWGSSSTGMLLGKTLPPFPLRWFVTWNNFLEVEHSSICLLYRHFFAKSIKSFTWWFKSLKMSLWTESLVCLHLRSISL